MRSSEAFFNGYQETRLFYQFWEAKNSKANLIITHGHGEHSECYLRVIRALADLPLRIFAWDLRGHGRSDGLRGYALNFEDYNRDYEALMMHLQREHQIFQKPLFLLAHSMGGLIQLKALTENIHWPVTAQALSSPMMGITVQIPFPKELAAVALRVLLPKITLNNEISYDDLSRDPIIHQEYDRDVLRHAQMSSGVYLGSLATMELVKAKTQRIQIPTLLQIAENDPVVSTEKNLTLFKKLGAKEKILKVYPDRKHEIYNDLGREEVLQDLHDFLQAKLG
jgi:alpha-beta hydrolase superfamily lysophospholipase